PPDPGVTHDEDVAEYRVEHAPIPALGLDPPFRNHDVVLLDHPDRGDGRPAHERVVLDLLVERGLPNQVKCPRHLPLDVVGQAGQDLRVIGPAEPLQVALDGALVLGHALSSVSATYGIT